MRLGRGLLATLAWSEELCVMFCATLCSVGPGAKQILYVQAHFISHFHGECAPATILLKKGDLLSSCPLRGQISSEGTKAVIIIITLI